MKKWASLLLFFVFGCASQPTETFESVLSLIRVVGDTALRVEGFAALQRTAPELIPLVDTDADRVITLAEVEALLTMATATPQQFAGIAAAAYVLLRERRVDSPPGSRP